MLGRPDAAAAGQLVIVAGGPADAIKRCEPAFQVMGRKTAEAGARPEAAIAIKLANNFVLACAIEAMAEGFALVRKYGVQPQVFYEVITEGLFAAPAYKVRQADGRSGLRQARLHGRPRPEGRQARAGGRRTGRVPLPSGSVVRDRLIGAIAHGDTDKDWAVLAREQGRACGLD